MRRRPKRHDAERQLWQVAGNALPRVRRVLGWVHIAFFSTIFWENTAEPLSMIAWLVNVFANGCAMVALGIFSAARGPLRLQRGLVTALASITVFGTIGLAFAQTTPDCLTLFASAMSGVGTAGLLLLWAEEYRNIPRHMRRDARFRYLWRWASFTFLP